MHRFYANTKPLYIWDVSIPCADRDDSISKRSRDHPPPSHPLPNPPPRTLEYVQRLQADHELPLILSPPLALPLGQGTLGVIYLLILPGTRAPSV